MNLRSYALISGISYLVIFFSAIFANFFVIENLLSDPLGSVQSSAIMVSAGILAFIITVVFDVVVAWGLYELYRQHSLSMLSTFFRMMHAAIMAVAVAVLPTVLRLTSAESILEQVNFFNDVWLVGLFFFGIHLMLLCKIIGKPKWVSVFLFVAGVMYMLDTSAHFVLTDYEEYKSIFLALVAIPSIVGEMSFSIWLLLKGGKE